MTREPETARALNWLGQQPVGSLLSSEWVTAEFSAALSIKVRTRSIQVDYRDKALARFELVRVKAFTIVPVVSSHFRIAARFADQHASGLRAGDALHLAIASAQGATLVTLDQRLASSAPMVGVAALLP